MNLTIIRRALWLVAAMAFGYAVFAYWTWRPGELVISVGVFAILIVVDIVLHNEEVARRQPRHGPVAKWGRHEPPFRTTINGTDPEEARRTLLERLTPTWFLMLMLIVVPAAGALYSAGQAHADTLADTAFIAALDSEGITYASTDRVITAGHAVCRLLDSGLSFLQTGSQVHDNTQMTYYDSGYFTGAAIAAYCPRYSSLIGSGQNTRA